MKKKKDKRRLFPYIVFIVRIIFGLFAMTVAVLFFFKMINGAPDRFTYAFSYLIPVIAAVIVIGDLYLHWKLDIRPLRKIKKGWKKNLPDQ